MEPSYGSPFPTVPQELLLKAGIFAGEPMFSAFEKWKTLVDFETDIQYASFRQLPLLYQNLNSFGVKDPLMNRLKGIYRKAWSKNQILFFKTGKVLQILHEAAIKTIVLKGVALTVWAYKNYAVRPMADMDILVPVSQASEAFELLKMNGWKSLDQLNDDYNFKYNKSITLISEDDTELDLHWYPFDECYGLMKDEDFWDRAVPLVVSGQKTLALNPADELLLTCVHGLMPNPEPPIRWIPDAATILKSANGTIDWKRFIEYTEKFGVIIPVKEAFRYLKENFKAHFPPAVYREIMEMKPSLADKLVYRKKGVFVYHPSFKKILSVYISFLKDPSRKGFFSKNIGFVKFMREKSRGKPYFKIFFYYLSVLLKSDRKRKNQSV